VLYPNTTGSSFVLSDESASTASIIPAVGSLNYMGGLTGYYDDKNKFAYITNDNIVLTSTLDKRTLNLTTSNTVIQGAPDGNRNYNTGLQLTGVLTYVSGTNNFTGTVTGASGIIGKDEWENGPGRN